MPGQVNSVPSFMFMSCCYDRTTNKIILDGRIDNVHAYISILSGTLGSHGLDIA